MASGLHFDRLRVNFYAQSLACAVTSSAARIPFRAVYREVFTKEVYLVVLDTIFAKDRQKSLELTETQYMIAMTSKHCDYLILIPLQRQVRFFVLNHDVPLFGKQVDDL